jgi:hypothetical protein
VRDADGDKRLARTKVISTIGVQFLYAISIYDCAEALICVMFGQVG